MKILGDICTKSRCSTGISDNSGKLAAGVNQYRWCCSYQWQICHRCQRYRQQICRRCQRHQWCTLNCKYLCEFSKKIWNGANGTLRGLGELIHEKNLHCPFKSSTLLVDQNGGPEGQEEEAGEDQQPGGGTPGLQPPAGWEDGEGSDQQGGSLADPVPLAVDN